MDAAAPTPFSPVSPLNLTGANPNLTANTISTVGQNVIEKNSHKWIYKILNPIFQLIGTVGATGTLVASIVSLVYIMQDSSSKTPYIATMVVAAVSVFFVLAKELYDMKRGADLAKADLKKDQDRAVLENVRHKQVFELLEKTIDILENHYEKPEKDQFKKSLQSIRQLPQRSKDDAVARDLLLSKIIQESGDKNIKSAVTNIEDLAIKVENHKKNFHLFQTKKTSELKVLTNLVPAPQMSSKLLSQKISMNLKLNGKRWKMKLDLKSTFSESMVFYILKMEVS